MGRQTGDTAESRGPAHGDGPAGAAADLAPLEELPSPASGAEVEEASVRAQRAFDAAVEAASAGQRERAVQEYLRAAAGAESAHEWYLTAVACQRVGDFLLDPRPPSDLQRALRMYRRAAAAYERCGLFNEARELTYRVLRLNLRRARELELPWHTRMELFLFWLTAGFGYRPLRVIGLAVVMVLLYGLAYWACGGALEMDSRQPASLWSSIYFSGITFATVGYGDLVPGHTHDGWP